MTERDIVVSIREVEPGLVAAVKKLSERLGRPLRGVVLIDKDFVHNKHRVRDETGFFEEVICDFDDPDALQRAIKPLTDRLLTVTCRFETAIQDFRKAIPFMPYIHTPSETSLLWSTEKRLMRDRMSAYDPALTPRYVPLTAYEPDKLKEMVKDFSFPVIVKPNGLYASLLVSRCDTYDELESALERTFDVIHEVYARENGTGQPSLLVEEMMQGDMYSVDVYVDARGKIECLPFVKVITAHSIGLPGFYTHGHEIPVDLTEEQIASGEEVAKGAVRALHLSSSTAHIELFLTEQGWKIVELGPRIGGQREALYREAYDIDHYYNDLANRIGLPLEISAKPLRYATGLNFYAEAEGMLEDIAGLDEARRIPGVLEIIPLAKPGDPALFADKGGTLIADGMMSGTDRDELARNVAKVRELVKIQIKPYDLDASAAA